ncbi:uncharacterized protein M437DRAFT_58544 [Aureobasidium melanogenum CBS 110374]|uniref:4'-phosphopantetheinyl transferase domain-containing protein n=1 Tax=Aureobasidium melanogenum (strain CBS 110374) TaxID=1043003 RepID=A0A074VEB9_AURM1|nr:uncharacterized protein M437DRAFT_58544 [Aureobasidium melanogenum CBS 110374]KEQ58733.1 hypothetical protein M437DRAFT_58544 [Aureobasidium melanogenum CBS 110374]
MPPRPFPQTLSIGTDICHYPRFLKYFPSSHQVTQITATSSSTPLFKLFDKTFLPSEQRVFWRRFPSPPQRSISSTGTESRVWNTQQANEAARYIASRWAAKEAVIKAYAAERRLMLRDVEIRKDAKTKQPFGVVRDEGEGKGYEDAREVFGKLRRRWELSRHTARKEDMPQQEPTTLEPETATAPTSSILSKNGILDLNAVTKLLDQDPKTTTSSAPQEAQQHNQTPDQQHAPTEPQTRQSQLEEEMKRLRKQEQAEDAFNNLQGQIVKLSISHDGEYCVATALAAV